jgi:hypothetical protein
METLLDISSRAKKFKRKAFEFIVLRSEMLVLQAVQKSNGVCVDTKPPSALSV